MEEQIRLLTIMDSYSLQPIAMIHGETGKEDNALIHKNHLSSVNESKPEVLATPAKKRSRDDPQVSKIMEATLYSALISGPFSKRLLSQSYQEIKEEMAGFLNEEWSLCPQMRYACSRLLADSILLDLTSGQAVLVNCVEIYGRRRTLDSHRENTKVKMGMPSTSSLPPSNSRYPAVWPVSIRDTDSNKLMIGTKTFNVLVTSSLRLDCSMDPEIGLNTSNFNLDTEAKSLGTKIFIKKTAWIAAKALADQPATNRLARHDVLSQLRQLRTKFHHSSTYLCCRASNEDTDDLMAKLW
ncbi:hypothetical protein CLU79DRAFT_309064 [Phycomyces nitens]|nr:hypothetical protein CLU79DRAFT_309064 [Phycomyces nitens]